MVEPISPAFLPNSFAVVLTASLVLLIVAFEALVPVPTWFDLWIGSHYSHR